MNEIEEMKQRMFTEREREILTRAGAHFGRSSMVGVDLLADAYGIIMRLAALVDRQQHEYAHPTHEDDKKLLILQKLFLNGDSLTIETQGEKYERAEAGTGGVGLACHATATAQDRAFSEAFSRETFAARPYIYVLERELIRRLSTEEVIR